MKTRILLPTLAGATLVVWACGEPMTPELTPSGPSLHTAPAPFMAVVTSTSAVSLTDPCLTITPGEPVIFEDCQITQTIAGGLFGGGTTTFSATLEGLAPPQQNGPIKGEFSWFACVAPGVCGDFEGDFEGEFVAGLLSDVFELEGETGAVEDIEISGTFTEQGPAPGTSVFDLIGTIRFPD